MKIIDLGIITESRFEEELKKPYSEFTVVFCYIKENIVFSSTSERWKGFDYTGADKVIDYVNPCNPIILQGSLMGMFKNRPPFKELYPKLVDIYNKIFENKVDIRGTNMFISNSWCGTTYFNRYDSSIILNININPIDNFFKKNNKNYIFDYAVCGKTYNEFVAEFTHLIEGLEI